MARLKKIAVMPLAKIFCCLHSTIGFILAVIVTIGSMSGQPDEGIWSLGPWSLLIFPVVNAGLGFLTGALLAWGYNFFSGNWGGIEFEIEENPQQ